jgi:hypothetical protein
MAALGELLKIFKGAGILDLVELVKDAMEVVEVFSRNQSGEKKRDQAKLIIHGAVNELKKDNSITEETANEWNDVIDVSGNIIFDIASLASKGMIAINKVKKCCNVM